MSSVSFLITPQGEVRFIYSDEASRLIEPLGRVRPRRASHVEPNGKGQWTSDMSPSNGPVLGPFATRQEALDAEVEWLQAHNLG